MFDALFEIMGAEMLHELSSFWNSINESCLADAVGEDSVVKPEEWLDTWLSFSSVLVSDESDLILIIGILAFVFRLPSLRSFLAS